MSYKVKVGNVYLNSIGQRCEIIAISQDGAIRYKLSNGDTYITRQHNILKHWKLQKENQMNIQPKYKPGDKVKVRADLLSYIRYKMGDSGAIDVASSKMLKYKGRIVTIKDYHHNSSGKYTLEEVGYFWTDEMFEGLAEEISQTQKSTNIPKYLDRPAQAGDYIERILDIAFFLADRNPSVICKVESTDSGDTVRINGKLYHSKRFRVLNPIHPEYPDHKQIGTPVEVMKPSKPEQKSNQKTETQMKKLDLVLLFQFLATQSTEKVDATNAKHIGILIDSEDSYVGYVYANTIKELQDIVRKPENEGRKLHIFDYSQTLAQKPRPVTKVARV